MPQVVLVPYSARNRENFGTKPPWVLVGSGQYLVASDASYGKLVHLNGEDDSDSLDAYTWREYGGAGTAVTWNPADKHADVALTNGDLTATAGSNDRGVRATVSKTSGKWYWEITTGIVLPSYTTAGVATASAALNNVVGADANGWGIQGFDGKKMTALTPAAYSTAFSAPDTIGVALDMDAKTITIYRYASPGVSVSAGIMYTGLPATAIFPIITGRSGVAVTANFGASAFAYSIPSGYSALQQMPPTPSPFDWTDKIISRIKVEVNALETSGVDAFLAFYATRENITGPQEIAVGDVALTNSYAWYTLGDAFCSPPGVYASWADWLRDYLYADTALVSVLSSNRSGGDEDIRINAYRITVDYVDLTPEAADQGLLWEL